MATSYRQRNHSYDPAADTDISTELTAYSITVRQDNGMFMSHLSIQPTWSNYTAVTVHVEGSVDGTNFVDIPGASTSTSGDILEDIETAAFDTVRVRVVGTLSVSTDTIDIWDTRRFES